MVINLSERADMNIRYQLILSMVFISLFAPMLVVAKTPSETIWLNTIKQQFYPNRTIEESDQTIEISAPYRAEDAALVPIKITSKIPQSKDKYIKTITLFIDKNPVPFSAEFHFTADSGRADLAMRVRINAYSYVRVIAELSDGTLTMHKKFVKASGGCSAPLGSDLDAAMKRMGKMKFRIDEDVKSHEPALTQLLISHPNISGLQMNQLTRLYTPAHFVEHLEITFNDKSVLTAITDIAISADPNFRFYFVPNKAGILKAHIKDNKGNEYSRSYEVKL